MKRGKPLRRRSPLRNKTPLRRTAAAHRIPEPRTPEETEARALVAIRSGGMCEVCGREPASDWHHRKPRSQGGRWSADNGLHLCRRDHAWITEHPADCYVLGWLVRRREDPADVPALRRGRTVHLRPDGSMQAADGKNIPLR